MIKQITQDPKYTKTYATIDRAVKAAGKVDEIVGPNALVRFVIAAVDAGDKGVRYTPVFFLTGQSIIFSRTVCDLGFQAVG